MLDLELGEVNNDNTLGRMPADNKRFGEIGGEVTVRISVRPLTCGDSPNCVQLTPQLRQAAGTLPASGGRHSGQ